MDNNKFLNVYNFIPLTEVKRGKRDNLDKHTGYIEYQITTKTPLFIPNTSDSDYFKRDNEHKSYDFFSYYDLKTETEHKPYEPVIPGSQVRGMFRSLYETLTNSCLSVINDDIELSKRSINIYSPGLLKKEGNNKFVLIKAKSYALLGSQNIDFKDGECIKFHITGKDEKNKNSNKKNKGFYARIGGNKTGTIFRGEMGLNIDNISKDSDKDNLKIYKYHIYEKRFDFDKRRDDEICKFNKEELIDKISKTIASYQDMNDKKYYDDYKKALYSFIDSGNNYSYFPINYYQDKNLNLLYLSCSRISREVSDKKIKDMIGDFSPCTDNDNLCAACDLFGMVNKESKQAKTSKIRFTDLTITRIDNNDINKYYYRNKLTLPTLGGPKISNTAFYLKKPDEHARYWTFDYYILDQQNKDNKGRKTVGYVPSIQGRKYYWHFDFDEKVLCNNVAEEKTNVTIHPIDKGVSFVGKMYFDGISLNQLEQLKLILSGFDGKCAYKIGTAKPLGLGSIDCKIKDIKERIVFKNNSPCYEENDLSIETLSYKNVGFDEKIEDAFKLICDFNACNNIEVSYPKKSNGDKGFEWYKVDLNKGQFNNSLKPLKANKKNSIDDLLLTKDGLGSKRR